MLTEMSLNKILINMRIASNNEGQLSNSSSRFRATIKMNEEARRTKARWVLSDSQINTIAGATSGAFVSVLVSPLDVVRTRIQVKRLPKGVPDTPLVVVMYRLSRREGLRAFYKGLGATMLVSERKLSM
jgi:hypothetical protein